jgi:DNA-binding NarL/FixJ family response regulator
VGRPRSSQNLREIAEFLARGKQQSWIAEHLEVSLSMVNRRVSTMRLEVARQHPDGATWLTTERTAMEVAIAFLELSVEE